MLILKRVSCLLKWCDNSLTNSQYGAGTSLPQLNSIILVVILYYILNKMKYIIKHFSDNIEITKLTPLDKYKFQQKYKIILMAFKETTNQENKSRT